MNSGSVTCNGGGTDGVAAGFLRYCTYGGAITFRNCLNEGDIHSETSVAGGIGGNIGSGDTKYDVTFENCTTSADITSNALGASGIYNRAATGGADYGVYVRNCLVTGSMTGATGAAGIASDNSDGDVIENCKVDATITAPTAAGISAKVGNGTIRNCTVASTSVITGTTASANDNTNAAGGIVGVVTAGTVNIENCLNEGTVTSTQGVNVHVGGIIGRAMQFTELNISNTVNKGAVTGMYAPTGGLSS